MFSTCRESRLETRESAGRTVTHVIDFAELREAEARTVSEELLHLARTRKPTTLRLDCAAVEFLTAAALGKLVALHMRLREAGRQLVLTNFSSRLVELFEITGLDTILDIRTVD